MRGCGTGKGLQGIAPPPFPAAVYRQSFSFDNDEVHHQFDALLQDSRVTAFVAPLPEKDMPTEDAGRTSMLERIFPTDFG